MMDLRRLGNEDLDSLFGPPAEPVIRAIKTRLSDFHRAYLAQARFFVLASGNGDGLDASPRGGSPGLVHVLDDRRVCFADWPGNNRIESLRNLLARPQVGMLFLFPGLDIFMRINGRAFATDDAATRAALAEGGRVPRIAIVVDIDEVLFHCGRAVNRAALWEEGSRIDRKVMPSPGVMMKELAAIEDIAPGTIDAEYDRGMTHDLY